MIRCNGQLLILIFMACSMGLIGEHAGAQQGGVKRELLVVPAADQIQIVKTKDGSKFLGRITEVRKNDIQFKTKLMSLAIPIRSIKEITVVPRKQIKSGEYWFENPNATRLLFAPTARMLKKGEGYFSDYYLFFPGVAYGVSDNVTIGGGVSVFPFVGLENQLFYFTPKIGLPAVGKVKLAAGALLFKIPDFDDGGSPLVGILYGVGTVGSTDQSLTFGLGYGFVDNDLAEKPMVMIGGEKRLSRKIALVSENWVIPGADQPLVSYGVRFFGEKLSVDLAFLSTIGDDMFFSGIPYIDFVMNF